MRFSFRSFIIRDVAAKLFPLPVGLYPVFKLSKLFISGDDAMHLSKLFMRSCFGQFRDLHFRRITHCVRRKAGHSLRPAQSRELSVAGLPGASVQKMPDLWTDGGVNRFKMTKKGTVSPFFPTFLDRRYSELRSVCNNQQLKVTFNNYPILPVR